MMARGGKKIKNNVDITCTYHFSGIVYGGYRFGATGDGTALWTDCVECGGAWNFDYSTTWSDWN